MHAKNLAVYKLQIMVLAQVKLIKQQFFFHSTLGVHLLVRTKLRPTSHH